MFKLDRKRGSTDSLLVAVLLGFLLWAIVFYATEEKDVFGNKAEQAMTKNGGTAQIGVQYTILERSQDLREEYYRIVTFLKDGEKAKVVVPASHFKWDDQIPVGKMIFDSVDKANTKVRWNPVEPSTKTTSTTPYAWFFAIK